MAVRTFSVGDKADPLRYELSRTDFVRYAGASRDFNPVHHDEMHARDAGMPTVMGHGMLSAALLANAVTAFVAGGTLRQYRVRFTRQTWPGDVLVTGVEVVGRRDEAHGIVIELSCRLVNQRDEEIVRGSASAVMS